MFDFFGINKSFKSFVWKLGSTNQNGNWAYWKEGIWYKYGQIEYLTVAIGAYHAPVTLQTLLDEVFCHFINLFFVMYIDTFVVFTEQKGSHYKH